MAVGKEALGATPPFQNPLERIGHTVREIPAWMGRHWKSLLLIVAAGGAAGSLYFLHDSGPQKAPVQPANPATDTFKPADPGADSEVVVPAVPKEVTPAAGASTSPEPPPTPEPTKTPPTLTAEPTQTPATPEAKNGFDCGIFSPEACAKAEYITWETPDGTTIVKMEGMGVFLGPGEKFKIPEAMQVAATERIVNGQPAGYRVAAARKDGSQINILGDITPIGVTRVGKNLPAGTIIAESTGSGVTILGKYTQLIQFSKQEELAKAFPEQAKNPPKFVENPAATQPQAQPQSAAAKDGGLVFFDVQPPKSR